MTSTPSGTQWTIERGADVLTVVEVGGGLRRWHRDGRSVLAGYAETELCLAGRGQLLLPWPNRIRDGEYEFEGVTHQLPLTEPRLGNASHGLVRFAPWHLLDHSPEAVTLGHRLFPQPGWDWQLDSTVTYRLTEDGLEVVSTVTNTGSGTAPYGYGAHPYVAIGSDAVEDLELTLPADAYMEVDDRLLPTGLIDVTDTAYDFRAGKVIGDLALDTAFTGLTRGPDGRWRITLAGLSDLPPVTLWADESFGWTQVFTGKAAAEGEHGVAIEPMTCPADAFNSGTDLVTLEPGASWTGTWGISLG